MPARAARVCVGPPTPTFGARRCFGRAPPALGDPTTPHNEFCPCPGPGPQRGPPRPRAPGSRLTQSIDGARAPDLPVQLSSSAWPPLSVSHRLGLARAEYICAGEVGPKADTGQISLGKPILFLSSCSLSSTTTARLRLDLAALASRRLASPPQPTSRQSPAPGCASPSSPSPTARWPAHSASFRASTPNHSVRPPPPFSPSPLPLTRQNGIQNRRGPAHAGSCLQLQGKLAAAASVRRLRRAEGRAPWGGMGGRAGS